MIQKLLLLFLLSFSNFLVAQNSEYENNEINNLITKGDSLKIYDTNEALNIYKKALAKALDRKNKQQTAILYKKIGLIQYHKMEYALCEKMYRKSILNDSVSKTTADVYFNMCLLKRKQNEQDSILFYLEKSLDLYKTLDYNKSSYNAFLTAGIIYKDRQLYNKAIEYLIIAYNGYKVLDNKKKLADVCITIANIQNQLKNYNQALEYHYEALNFKKEIKDSTGIGVCYTNMANVNDNLKMVDSAITNYKKALLYLSSDYEQYGVLTSNLATVYLKNGQTKLANKYFKQSIKINKKLNDTVSLLYGYNGLTSLYLKNKSYNLAAHYLDSIKLLLSSTSDKIVKLDYLQNKVELSKSIRQYETALEHQIEYSNLYKEIYNIELTEIVQTNQSKFDYERKENEILKLSLANKNKQLQLIEKNKDIGVKNVILLILGFVVLLSLIIHYIFNQKQKVAKQTVKIEKLEAIYKGQETIKKRIARDLHDIITTNFDGLRLKILALKRSPKVNESIDGITNELKNINQQIRIVSHRLYPLEMQMGNQKFTDVIKSRLSEFQLYGNIFVELENQLPEILNSQSISIQNNFYGILLEILNNVEKHSHATKINIKHFVDKKQNIHFVFSDNGIGIKTNPKEGIGLLNIRQRCDILDGKSYIEKIESGTEIRISFPIKEDV